MMGAENGQSAKEAYLAELRAEIDRLSALVAAIESGGAILAGNGVVTAAPGRGTVETQVRPDSFFGMTTPQAVRRFLEMMGKGNPQTPAAIADALIRGGLDKPENKDAILKNVYTAFKRGKDVDFVKIHKEWGLTEWYPNRKAAEEKPAGKRGKKRKGKGKGKPRTEKKGNGDEQSPALTLAPANATGVGWRAFLKEQLKAGKSMPQAAEEWRGRQAAGR